MFNRCDLPLDGSALLDDVIVSELAARRPAPITDSAVGLLATLVTAVDSRPIPDHAETYEEILRIPVAEPTPLTTAPMVIHRTWDGPRHRKNRPTRRRVTGSVAVISVVASTVSISGMAAAVGGDPLRPFHTVVTRVWHGFAGGGHAPDAPQAGEKRAHHDSTKRAGTKHPQASTGAGTSHHHPARPATAPSSAGAPVEDVVTVEPTTPGWPSDGDPPTFAGSPVETVGTQPVEDGPVTEPGEPNEPGYPSGPVWSPPVSLPSAPTTPPHLHAPQPTLTVQVPIHP